MYLSVMKEQSVSFSDEGITSVSFNDEGITSVSFSDEGTKCIFQ